jgi:sulfite reductase beta subunit-like hemoprotein
MAGRGQQRPDHRYDLLPGPRLLRPGQCPFDPDCAGNFAQVRLHRSGREIGDLKIKISGCINACGHHHVGHIGILGVEKKGGELYQITLGGDATRALRWARSSDPASKPKRCRRHREAGRFLYRPARERRTRAFIDAYRRLGEAPFKEALVSAMLARSAG